MHTRTNHRAVTSSKVTLLILIALFSLPMFLAHFFYHHQSFLKKKLNSHGKLITPPISIHSLSLYNEQHQHIDTLSKWAILSFQPKPCTLPCLHTLYNMRQIQRATGKNRPRVTRVIITLAQQKIKKLLINNINKRFKGTRLLTILPQQYIKTQHDKSTLFALQPGALYLVDPHGNIILHYAQNADPNGIFKDLQHLLKLSQIG